MNLSNWRSQIRKGLIEFCLLHIIQQRGKAYGLELLEDLARAEMNLSEGTLYPLLSRLVKEDYLQSQWFTPDSGHPRKYYSLTTKGRKSLKVMEEEWEKIVSAVDRFSNESGGKVNVRQKNSAEAQ